MCHKKEHVLGCFWLIGLVDVRHVDFLIHFLCSKFLVDLISSPTKTKQINVLICQLKNSIFCHKPDELWLHKCVHSSQIHIMIFANTKPIFSVVLCYYLCVVKCGKKHAAQTQIKKREQYPSGFYWRLLCFSPFVNNN